MRKEMENSPEYKTSLRGSGFQPALRLQGQVLVPTRYLPSRKTKSASWGIHRVDKQGKPLAAAASSLWLENSDVTKGERGTEFCLHYPQPCPLQLHHAVQSLLLCAVQTPLSLTIQATTFPVLPIPSFHALPNLFPFL